MKQLLDACHFRAPFSPPGSAKSLFGKLGGRTGNSLSALLRAAGPFIPARDAYSFTNSAEGITLEDAAILRGIYQGVVNDVAQLGADALRNALGALSIDVPLAGAVGLPAVAIDVMNQVAGDILNQLVDAIIASVPGTYGRCGGFVFSAFDFFLAGWPIDTWDTLPPGSGDLRDFIWTRLINSLQLNASTFLSWLMTLNVLPGISVAASAALGAAAGTVIGGPLGAALGALLAGKNDVLGLGGTGLLLGNTRDHLNQLSQNLSSNAAWPIGFIHGDKFNPTDQHQVLAIGYQTEPSNQQILKIWDCNNGQHCTPLTLDTTGSELMVKYGNDPSTIKGIICDVYSTVTPPQSLKTPWKPPLFHWSPACS